MTIIQLFAVLFGAGVRWFFSDTTISVWLTQNCEVNTAQTAWKRNIESFALLREGISPYSGDLYHEVPLLMHFLNYFNNLLQAKIGLLFVACDVMTSLVLGSIAENHSRFLLLQQASNVRNYATDADELLLKSKDLKNTKTLVIVAYLLSPFSIATCLAKSTTCFHNLALSLAILYTFKGRPGFAAIFIAISAYLSLYPMMLLVPLTIYVAQKDTMGVVDVGVWRATVTLSVLKTCSVTLFSLGLLLYSSVLMEGSTKFLEATYGFMMSVPELNPNVGLFWYFLTEMFDHFWIFFVCIFQLNIFLYVAPLAIKFRQNPLFLAYIFVMIAAIFKAYPSYGDMALYAALLPLWKHLYMYMRNVFLVCAILVVTTVLAPILYYLWMYAGSANANFYFAVTLVYSTAQIFLLSDLLFAQSRREYHLHNGVKVQEFEGQKGLVVLE